MTERDRAGAEAEGESAAVAIIEDGDNKTDGVEADAGVIGLDCVG